MDTRAADDEPADGPAAAHDGYVPDDELLSTAGVGGVRVEYGGDGDLRGVPARADFVAAAARVATENAIASGGALYFMPTSVVDAVDFGRNRSQAYALRLYGALACGSKAEITVTEVPVFFDIRVPDGEVEIDFVRKVNALLTRLDLKATLDTHLARPMRGYRETDCLFVRVTTENLSARKAAINAAIEAGMQTMSDDLTNYHRKVSRENGIPLCNWLELRNVETALPFWTKHVSDAPDICEYRLRVKLPDVAAAPDAPREDRTLVVGWDIETHSNRGLGELPRGEVDEVFMIAMSAHWANDPAPIARVCLVTVDSAPDPRWTTVVCRDSRAMLLAFARCWRSLAPDIVIGFNDSDYDWPFIFAAAERFGVFGEMCALMTAENRKFEDADKTKWCKAENSVKLGNDQNIVCRHISVAGAVAIDVRVCFKKLFPADAAPKAGSLKHYLGVCGLPGKADMPIARMWQYFVAARDAAGDAANKTAAIAEKMREVAHYCVVDAVRCQALLVRRRVIAEYREVGTLAYVSLFDCHYRAGGVKVCNLLGAYAAKRNMLVSVAVRDSEKTGQYPGAYVFPPEKGLVPDPRRIAAFERAAREGTVEEIAAALAALAPDRPVTGLDFSSLYPSLIMAYNFSPEMILLTPAEAEAARAAGRKLYEISFVFGGQPVVGWSVRHEGDPARTGLYPKVLKDLFDKRAAMKAAMKIHGEFLELVGVLNDRAGRDQVPLAEAARRVSADAAGEVAASAAACAPGAPPPVPAPGATVEEELAEMRRAGKRASAKIEAIAKLFAGGDFDAVVAAETARATFEWAAANTKQGALKVYMNTFYGEAGNNKSPFFLLQLAGGVTSAGQENLRRVADFVRSQGFRIKYGDTDSVYIQAPSHYFAACDADYADRLRSQPNASREDWYAAQVRVTMRAVGKLRDLVNAHLRENNGTPYLSMAYEEVLFPVDFDARKKYYGIGHEHDVNFRPKKLFIRGIDVVKRGQSQHSVEIGHRIMWRSVRVDNAQTVREIVEEVLVDSVVRADQWKFDDFVKTDAWKPHRNNIPVHRFISRMRARLATEQAAAARGDPRARPALYELPEPGERFSYVIVRTDTTFDICGRRVDTKKGDRMEFARAARELALPIDVAFYMISYIVGLCARFITDDPEFAAPAGSADPDKHSQNAARRALVTLVRKHSGDDPDELRRRGAAYRRAFRDAASISYGNLVAAGGDLAASLLQGPLVNFEVLRGNVAAVGALPDASASDASADDALPDGAPLPDEYDDDDETKPDARACAHEEDSRFVEAMWVAAARAAEALKPADGTWVDQWRKHESPAACNAVLGAGRRAHDPAAAYVAREREARDRLARLAPAAGEVAEKYAAHLSALIQAQRSGAPEVANPLQESDYYTLREVQKAWFAATAAQTARRRRAQLSDDLRRRLRRELKIIPAPSRAEQKSLVSAAARNLQPRGDIVGRL